MDTQPKSRWQRLRRFMRNRYRLVILNDTTFAERFSLRLSPWGLAIGITATTIIMTSLVISLIAFTPLREYIPGYGDVTERRLILGLNVMADSLEQSIDARDQYYKSVLDVIHERPEKNPGKPVTDSSHRLGKINLDPGEHDKAFRKDYEDTKGGSSGNIARLTLSGLGEQVFFAPVSGMISSAFELNEDHFGVDVVTRPDEAVKSTLDGTVIFTGFSAEDGNLVQIQHSSNLISIYKHCSTLLVHTGDRVKSGEVIGVVGNTGENSRGPHLHFELWFNGSPVNPQEFVAF